jgi:hypothetical protein
MLKKNFFKSYAIIIALAAILILPVLVNAQDMSAFQAKGMEAKAAQPMAKCMAQTKGNQALCEKKVMDYLERRNSAGSQAQQGSADGSPPSAMGSDPRSQTRGGSKSMGSDPRSQNGSPPSAMGSDPRSQTRGGSKSMGSDPRSQNGSPPSAMGSDPRSQTRGGSKSMGSDPARAKRDNRGGAKASPLCQINPRHLNKRALKKREKRCN